MSPATDKPKPTNIVLEYVQTGEGVPDGGKTGKLSQKDRTLDPKLHLTCANPACKKGGFLLRKDVDKAIEAGKGDLSLDLKCVGYVGPLRTERGPAPGCENRVKATVKISYARPADHS
jgi:hypothetical protein